MKKYLILLIAINLIAINLLVGCGGNNDSSRVNNASRPRNLAQPGNLAQQHNKIVTISGIIRNEKTLIKSGKIEATDNSGNTVATQQFKDASRFSLDIPAGTTFPVLLTVYPDADQSKNEILKVVAMNPYATDQIITKVTTTVANNALALGGYTRENMMKAAMGTVAAPDGDKTVGGFRGDPTKQYGGWH